MDSDRIDFLMLFNLVCLAHFWFPFLFLCARRVPIPIGNLLGEDGPMKMILNVSLCAIILWTWTLKILVFFPFYFIYFLIFGVVFPLTETCPTDLSLHIPPPPLHPSTPPSPHGVCCLYHLSVVLNVYSFETLWNERCYEIVKCFYHRVLPICLDPDGQHLCYFSVVTGTHSWSREGTVLRQACEIAFVLGGEP